MSLPIGSILPLNFYAIKYVKEGEVWLRSGNTETNTTLYPDAPSPIGLPIAVFDEDTDLPLYMRIK